MYFTERSNFLTKNDIRINWIKIMNETKIK